MTPPDTRVMLVAALIIAGLPVAVHEYREHAHHRAMARVEGQDARSNWGAANANSVERAGRPALPAERPSR